MSDHKLRCGDTVRQHGATYDLEVSYADYESGRASWAGWPDGLVPIEELTLVKACTDQEHRAAVSMWLDKPRTSESERDHRRNEVERLYRPRAYWSTVRDVAYLRAQDAASALTTAEMMLREAERGPEDVAAESKAVAS